MSYEEVERLTDVRASTFAYTTEDSEQILFPALMMEAQADSWETQYNHLESLRKKETRALLHGSVLSQYWRNKRIPRGLRIMKEPTLGREDPDFCKKWCEILNKCSLDLMLLVIESQNKKLATVKQEIADMESELKGKYSSAKLKELLQKCEEQINVYKTETQQKKMEKYRRDTIDYRNDNVYPWLRENRGFGGRPRQRQRQRNTVSSASSADRSTDTERSTDRRFLRSNPPAPGPSPANQHDTERRGGGKKGRGARK